MHSTSAPQEKYRLMISFPDGRTEIRTLNQGPLTIGRGSDCGITINEHVVSRNHCVLFPLANSLHVKDLGSSNGTFVNNKKITHCVLKNQDELHVGNAVINISTITGPDKKENQKDSRHPADVTGGLSLVDALSALLDGSQDLAATAKAALGLLNELIPADYSSILLTNNLQATSVRELAAMRSETRAGQVIKPNATLIRNVLKSGQAFYGKNPSGRSDQQEMILCTPLECNGETIGVIYAAGNTLSADDENQGLFEGIASQSAMSIAGASQHVRVQARQDCPEDEVAARSGISREPKKSAPPEEFSNQRAHDLEALIETTKKLNVGLIRDSKRLMDRLNDLLNMVSDPATDQQNRSHATVALKKSLSQIVGLTNAFQMAFLMNEGSIGLSSDVLSVGSFLVELQSRSEEFARLGHVDLDFTGCQTDSEAVVDPGVIKLVLEILIHHAIFLSSPGGWVTVNCLTDGGTVKVRIEESGGQSRKDDRFQMIMGWENGEKPDEADLGALLTFCRLAVDGHGGQLNLQGDRTATLWTLSLPSTGDEDMEPTVISRATPFLLELREKWKKKK